jgi:hypothetical protein
MISSRRCGRTLIWPWKLRFSNRIEWQTGFYITWTYAVRYLIELMPLNSIRTQAKPFLRYRVPVGCWKTSQSLILPLARGYHSSKSQLSSYQLSPLLFTITISDYPSQIITSSTLVPDWPSTSRVHNTHQSWFDQSLLVHCFFCWSRLSRLTRPHLIFLIPVVTLRPLRP